VDYAADRLIILKPLTLQSRSTGQEVRRQILREHSAIALLLAKGRHVDKKCSKYEHAATHDQFCISIFKPIVPGLVDAQALPVLLCTCLK